MSNHSSDAQLLALAESHHYAMQYEKALDILDTALQIQGLLPAHLNAIRLRRLAYQIEYFWLINRLDFMTLQSQLEVSRENAFLRDDSAQIALSLFLTARLHHFYLFESTSPDLEMVEQAWITAHNHYQQLGDERGMAESLFYHGLLYQRFKADQEEALKYFQRAHDLLKDKHYPIEQSEINRHTGYVYQYRGDLAAARTCFEQAVTLLDQVGFRPYLPLALYPLGILLTTQGQLDEAAGYFERSLAVAQEAPPNILHVSALLGLGELYAAKGDLALARDHVQRAYNLASMLKSTRLVKFASDKLATLDSQRL